MKHDLFNKISEYKVDVSQAKIEKALNFVEGFTESSQEILDILLPLSPDEDTILAVLLYEFYAVGGASEEKLKEEFGEQIYSILQQIQKIFSINYAENDKSSRVEILRKMVMSMAKELRVILIVLAYRLYRMRKMDRSGNQTHNLNLAKETLDLYAPIATRLGIYRIKNDLEELAFKFIDRDEYTNIYSQLKSYGEMRHTAIGMIADRLREVLKENGYDAEVIGRLKAIYSIYKKFRRNNINKLDDLHDVFAMRVILPSEYDANGKEVVDHVYRVLGLLHSEWKPISKRFKDYVAVPKPNGYRSLHTVVLGLAPSEINQPVEIQIRTQAMHNEAEYGVASHWLYKEGKTRNLDSHVTWIKGLETIKNELGDDNEILGEVEVDIFKDRIFVLTPRGDVKDLPLGSTIIDFAYAVHTDVGNKCVMAKVDGNVVPLDYELKNGEVVEIITKKESSPKLQWLSIANTSLAKAKIKAFFSRFDRDRNIREGKRLLNNYLSRLGKPLLDQKYSILKKFGGERLNLSRREDILEEVGRGTKLAGDIVRNVFPYEEILENIVRKEFPKKFKDSDAKQKSLSAVGDEIVVCGEEGLPIKISKCCSPKRGDNIIAYVTRGNSLSIHKSSCSFLSSLTQNRIIAASWKGDQKASEMSHYIVKLCITIVKRVGLIRDITSIISSFGMNIIDLQMKDGNKKVHDNIFVLEMNDLDKFDALINRLESVKGVLKVVRQD